MRNARMIGFLVTGMVLTYILLAQSGSMKQSVSRILIAVGKADVFWLTVSLGLFGVTQVVRAWRWNVLSWDHAIKLKQSLPLTAVHVGLGHILPVRLSDVVLVGLFKRYASVPLGSGAAAVVLAKLMDVTAMGFVVSCSFIAGLSGPVVYIAASASLAGIVSMFFLPVILSSFLKPVNRVFGNGRVCKVWKEMAEATEITSARKTQVSAAITLSIAGWAVKLFMFYALLRSVGVDGVPMWQVFTASAITDLAMALPVHGLLSLGTVETGGVAGFALSGVSGVLPGGLSVVEAGFSVHLLWLSMAVLLMLCGAAVLALSGRKGSI
jgi:uncharacterized protein (TIRG00374 family)